MGIRGAGLFIGQMFFLSSTESKSEGETKALAPITYNHRPVSPFVDSRTGSQWKGMACSFNTGSITPVHTEVPSHSGINTNRGMTK